MKRKLLSTLLIAMTAAFLVACAAPGQDSENAAQVEVTQPDADAANQTTIPTVAEESSEDSTESAKDFKTTILTPDTITETDLGSDGTQDAITIALNQENTNNHGINVYDLKVNDKIIPVLSEDDIILLNTFNFYYLHQNGKDYLLVSLEGNHGLRSVKLFQWDGSTFQQKDDIQGSKVYEIREDFVLLAESVDIFGTWEVTKNYTIDANDASFATEDKYPKIANPNGLKLKKDFTFEDESGDAPKTAKAGDVIYPSGLTNGNNAMEFKDKDGNVLGYMPIAVKDGGTDIYVNGIKETDLFANDFYTE